MSFTLDQTWYGVAGKVGSTVGILGIETIDGRMFNLANLNTQFNFGLTNMRVGLGFGGGGGVVAMMMFHISNPKLANGTVVTDWGVNLTVGEKWDSIIKGLKNAKFFSTAIRIGAKLKNFNPSDIDDIKTGVSYIYNAYDIAKSDGKPQVLMFDVPGAGLGLEISANYTAGKLKIL